METEHFVSLSTVSLRLIKQPEHRPEFEKNLIKELRETLAIPETVAVTTMPDSPSWWTRAKTIAIKMEAERKFAEEHPECARSPHGKHEWRFGTCVWCGTPATEVKPEEVKKEKERLPWQSWIQPVLEYITDMTVKEGWAKHEDLHREWESRGMTHEEVDKVVAQLEREGTIYQPRAGFYRKTTPCPTSGAAVKGEAEKRFYYCDNPRHPYSEVVQILTYEPDPKCPICLATLRESRVMTYGKYWR